MFVQVKVTPAQAGVQSLFSGSPNLDPSFHWDDRFSEIGFRFLVQ